LKNQWQTGTKDISNLKREKGDSYILAGDRSPPFSSGSERKCISKFNKFQVQKLLQDKHFFPLPKLPEIPNQLLDLLRTKHHGIHKITSEDSLKYIWDDAQLLKHFSKRFKITNPHPVLIDDSGYVGIMEKDM
jgi:hypothetical protein